MLDSVQFDSESNTPVYRQLYQHVRNLIHSGNLECGVRLPATRELAGQLGLNRTTVSAAYELLEGEGLIRGHVGRGSFVDYQAPSSSLISFASSRPAECEFPLAEFQSACREVIESREAAAILQLGSPSGYAPLRQYLLTRAQEEGTAGPNDDILITSGCQQAVDLLQRTQVGAGECAAIEDPVYHGVKQVFARAGRVVSATVGKDGIDVNELAGVLATHRPKLLLVTPNFQNPTGATMPVSSRAAVLEAARQFGVLVAENDIYRELRYRGESLPSIKQLDSSGNTILIRSFSKIAFPGLRVGWMIGPKRLIAELTEARQWCDLHTDQLSQAVLLRFAQSGRLDVHLRRVRQIGAQKLSAVLDSCARHLPAGSQFTRPEGGMSLWVQLPGPLDTTELLPRAQQENVSYLAGKLFAVSAYNPGALRLSFGGLTPAEIESGLARLGKVFTEELARLQLTGDAGSGYALV